MSPLEGAIFSGFRKLECVLNPSIANFIICNKLNNVYDISLYPCLAQKGKEIEGCVDATCYEEKT